LWVLFVNVKVDKDVEGDENADSVDDEAWNGLLSDTESEDSEEGNKSKDIERGQKSV
jgi:hypothetical protein